MGARNAIWCKTILFIGCILTLCLSGPAQSQTTIRLQEQNGGYNQTAAPGLSPPVQTDYSRLGSQFVAALPRTVMNNLTACRTVQSQGTGQCTQLNASAAPYGAFVHQACNNPAAGNGQWTLRNSNRKSWDSVIFTFREPWGQTITVPNSVTQTFTITESTQCLGMNIRDNKEFCTFGSGASGITGNTGDDMFRINNGAGAYFEYRKVGTPGATPTNTQLQQMHKANRLSWIRRNDSSADAARGLMIPSGPLNTYADFRRFLSSPPAGVTAEPACYPIYVNISRTSEDLPRPPPVNGVCGGYNGSNEVNVPSIRNVSNGSENKNYCNKGRVINKTESSTHLTWQCSSLYGGAQPSCSASLIPRCSNFFNGWQVGKSVGSKNNAWCTSGGSSSNCQGGCATQHLVNSFYIINPGLLDHFRLTYVGWDDRATIRVNGNSVWEGSGGYRDCNGSSNADLRRSPRESPNRDLRGSIRPGNNSMTMDIQYGGGGEGWYQISCGYRNGQPCCKN